MSKNTMKRSVSFVLVLLALFMLVLPLSLAAQVSSCQTIDSPGTYTLTQDLSTDGTCFTITANDVTLDGAGYKITGDYGAFDYGVRVSNAAVVNVQNLEIDNFGTGINSYSSEDVTIKDNIVTSSFYYGIYVYGSDDGFMLENNDVDTVINTGIVILDSSNGEVYDNTVSNAYIGISIDDEANNHMVKGGSYSGSTYDVNLVEDSVNNVFLSVDYTKENVEEFADSELIRQWHLNVNVEDTAGSAVENAEVEILDFEGNSIFLGNTDNNGEIAEQIVTEYINFDGSVTYKTPHTINVMKDGESNSVNVEVDEDEEVTIVLNVQDPFTLTECKTLDSPGTYTLAQDIVTDGTCFTITANDVTLDGAGFEISGDSGLFDYGVYNSQALSNVVIKNLDISDFSRCINVQNLVNFEISNGNLNCVHFGAHISDSSNGAVTDVFFDTSDFSGTGMYLDKVSESIFANNLVSLTGFGLSLYESTNNEFNYNDFGASSYGIYLDQGSSNNLFFETDARLTTYDSMISVFIDRSSSENVFVNGDFTNEMEGTEIQLQEESLDNRFINSQYSSFSEYTYANSELIRQWYLNVKVEDSEGTVLEGANVEIKDKDGTVVFSGQTGSDGMIEEQTITEYINVDGVRTYETQHTVSASKDGAEGSVEVVIDSSKDVTLTLENQAQVISSCQTIKESGDYVLEEDLLVAGNKACFIIKADNVNLDCKNNKIFSESSRRHAIRVHNADNVKIENCVIDMDNGRGIRLKNTENVQILNNDIDVKRLGILLNKANSNTIEGNDIDARIGIRLYRSDSNTISGNFIESVRDIVLRKSYNNIIFDNA